MAQSEVRLWTYSFYVWPDESRSWGKSMFALFHLFQWRAEVEMAADAFANFRASLAKDGITLHEISRVPLHEPETVL